MKKLKAGDIIYRLIAIVFFLIFIYPIYFTVVSSFKTNTEIWNTMFALPSKIEWSNYTSAIFDVGILRAVLNSFIFSFGACMVVVVFVTMASLCGGKKADSLFRRPASVLPAGTYDSSVCHADSHCYHVYKLWVPGQILAYDSALCGH